MVNSDMTTQFARFSATSFKYNQLFVTFANFIYFFSEGVLLALMHPEKA